MMPTEAPEVAEFLQELEHPMKDGILKLRDAILASDDQITDHIKWNAPSFIEWSTPDRGTVTMRDLEDVDAELPTVVELVSRWMRATA